MPQICDKPSYSRLLVLVWVSIWMLTVRTRAHPERQIIVMGMCESCAWRHSSCCFLPGPSRCEYKGDVHDPACPNSMHYFKFGSFSHAFNHPEISFSLLTVPIDRPLSKSGILVSGLPCCRESIGSFARSCCSLQPNASHAILFLSTALPLRAPPSRFL